MFVTSLNNRGWDAVLVDPADKTTEVPEQLAGLVLIAPKDPIDGTIFLRDAFDISLNCSRSLAEHHSFFISISRLGGRIGFDTLTHSGNAEAAGIGGIVKSASHEWANAHCRTLDIDNTLTSSVSNVETIVDAAFVGGPVELGIEAGGGNLITTKLTKEPAVPSVDENLLQKGDLLVVSGGARGVTASVALSFSEKYQPTMLLLGRSPLPASDPYPNAQTEKEVRTAILAEGKMKPLELKDKVYKLQAMREVWSNIAKMEAAGSKVLYRSVDVRDGDQVSGTIAEAEATHGPVKGIVHGAGVLADRLIVDKTMDQYDRVSSTKLQGLSAIMQRLDKKQLRCLVFFSSSTGRFGRKGQSDYAVSNEALNKLAQFYRSTLPECRTVAVNWGPWDGGMVTPALKALFASEGIGCIDLKGGAEYLINELAVRSSSEIVILGSTPDSKAEQIDRKFQTVRLSVNDMALKDHVINGKAVVPAALIAEYMCQTAVVSNLKFAGLKDFSVFKGIILESDADLRMIIYADAPKKVGNHFERVCEVHSKISGGKEFLNARGTIILTDSAALPADESKIKRPGSKHTEGVYPETLFHGPLLQCIETVYGCSKKGIAGQVTGNGTPATWLQSPMTQEWVTDPLAIDAAFQFMILWSNQELGMRSLPTKFEDYKQFRDFPKTGCEVRMNVTSNTENKAVADFEFIDDEGDLIATMDGYEATVDSKLSAAFARNQLEITAH
jgi:NAD(P)-dependent dehydrogenase (short-subunit alcohol dehydrogenase family)